jgi:hypothetical protein
LWENPHLEPTAVLPGISYDDHFTGGWDELFPNDAAGPVGDSVYPDHGELWCRPWDWDAEAGEDEVTVTLRVTAPAAAAKVEKRITIARDSAQVRFRHRIENYGAGALNFLFKMHPALAIDSGDRIDVPGALGELVDPNFSTTKAPRTFVWPIAENGQRRHDFSEVPDFDGTREFVYVRDLRAGWCALRRVQLDTGIALTFPREIFTSVWLFMTFGGWRGLRTIVLEPCTAYPKDLNAAIAGGTASTLDAGSSMEWESSAVILDSAAAIRAVHPDGNVDWAR